MPTNDSITEQEIIYQLKISCQFPTIIRNIFTQKIIKDTAEAKQVTLNESELQQVADSFRLQNNLISAEETYSWLEKHQLSTNDFEYLIHSQALATKLARVLFAEEAEAYFYEHKLDYTKAVIYEIVLPNFDLALELFYGIQEREFNFWELAHKYIADLELSRQGGYRGLLSRDELNPELSAIVFAAQPPQVLKPILVDKQAHLIYVEEIIHLELNETLRKKIIDRLFKQWLDKKLKEIYPNINSSNNI